MASEDTMRSLRIKNFCLIQDSLQVPYQDFTATGTAVQTSGLITISATSTSTITLPAPAIGEQLIIYDNHASGSPTLKVYAGAGVTFDGTNTYATFGTAGQQLTLFAISATRWLIIGNLNTVTLGTS